MPLLALIKRAIVGPGSRCREIHVGMLVGGKETPEANELTVSFKTNSEIMMAKSEVVLTESPEF